MIQIFKSCFWDQIAGDRVFSGILLLKSEDPQTYFRVEMNGRQAFKWR